MPAANREERRPRILYLHGTKEPPAKKEERNPFIWLSETLEGEVLQRIWWKKPSEVTQHFGDGSYPSHTMGRFRFHWLLMKGKPGLGRWVQMVRFFIRTGRSLHRERPFDCIVTYSHMTTGVCGAVLKLLLRVPLIVQVVTSPEHIGISTSPRRGIRGYLARAWSDLCLHISLLSADCAHLLAPNLLDSYPLLKNVKSRVFHNFVAASNVPPGDTGSSTVILLVGTPWYLKGADLLVRAFLRLADDYPGARLRMLGHFRDTEALDALIDGHDRIEILKAVPNEQALEIISGAAILVLASRCEGMGRVLLEAMSAGLPVVGSQVGGIPHVICDGDNGFLFPNGDTDALEARLRTLLSDPELRRRMGMAGKRRAQEKFTEQRYGEHFTAMVRETAGYASE